MPPSAHENRPTPHVGVLAAPSAATNGRGDVQIMDTTAPDRHDPAVRTGDTGVTHRVTVNLPQPMMWIKAHAEPAAGRAVKPGPRSVSPLPALHL